MNKTKVVDNRALPQFNNGMGEKKTDTNGVLLKQVMLNWASGVAVITSSCMSARAGTTVSSFTSLSLDPPLILVNLAKENPTQTMISQSGHFGLTILNNTQQDTANLFAGFGKRIQDRFELIETFTLTSGAPLIQGGIAHLDCQIYDVCMLPRSAVIIGEVIDGKWTEQGDPLLYFNRDYTELTRPGRSAA